jgi:hypothetical protein
VNARQITHPGVPNKDDLRLAAAALSPSEFLEHMQNTVFAIDVGAKDGFEYNQNLTAAYFANHSKIGGDL